MIDELAFEKTFQIGLAMGEKQPGGIFWVRKFIEAYEAAKVEQPVIGHQFLGTASAPVIKEICSAVGIPATDQPVWECGWGNTYIGEHTYIDKEDGKIKHDLPTKREIRQEPMCGYINSDGKNLCVECKLEIRSFEDLKEHYRVHNQIEGQS